MARVMRPFLLLGIAACSGKPAAKAEVDARAVAAFARTLDRVASADPTQSAAMLAQGAYESVARSEKCLESFAAAPTPKARVEALIDCGLACTLDAVHALRRKEPRTWMTELAWRCEPDHFGLESREEAAMLSPEWFLLHKVGELAAPHVKAAKGPDKAKLEQAMAAYHLPLPLPAVATGFYQLPVAPEAASVPVATRTYVIVPALGELHVGATPFAALGALGATLGVPQGRALFPGEIVARADLEALVLEAAGPPPKEAPPEPPEPPDAAPTPPADVAPPRGQYKMKGNVDQELAKKQAIEDARKARILGGLGLLDTSPRAGLGAGTLGLPPGLHGEVNRSLHGDLGRDGEPVPLLLADASLPAAEVIELASSMPHVLVAVASPDDTAARALAVELAAVVHTARSPDQTYVPLGPGWLEAAKKAAAGSDDMVVIRVEGGVTWQEAIEVAAVAIARGARRLALTSDRLGHGASGQAEPPVGRITDMAPIAAGELDKHDQSVIRRIVRTQLVLGVRACYERALLASPKLAGRLDLEFTIAADGSVIWAKAAGLAEVNGCTEELAKLMKFPKPAGGRSMLVRYPLILQPMKE